MENEVMLQAMATIQKRGTSYKITVSSGYDLSGKQILPFYSHCGGVPCDLRRDIQALCPRAEVGEPLGILDEETGEAAEQIQQWLIRQGLIVSLRK